MAIKKKRTNWKLITPTAIWRLQTQILTKGSVNFAKWLSEINRNEVPLSDFKTCEMSNETILFQSLE